MIQSFICIPGTFDVRSIIQKLPFFENDRTLRIPNGPVVAIWHHQIVLWVSISEPGRDVLPAGTRRFPALLDTGFNGNFLIREQHLVDWVGMASEDFAWIDDFVADGQRIPARDADVWIYPNLPGFRDQFADAPPFRMELADGIGIWPANIPGSRRLPLLGLRGLKRAGMRVLMNCRRSYVTIHGPG